MGDEPKLRGRAKLVVGFLFAAAGVLPILAALDVPGLSGGKNAPDWVVGLAGFMFILGGGAIWAQGTAAEKMVGMIAGAAIMLGLAAIGHWTALLAGGAIMLGLAAIGNWIAFGAGERACSGSVSSWLFSSYRDAGEWECRAAFGIGAALLDAFILLGVARLLETVCGRRPWIALLEKLAWGVVLLALSPLLLLLIVFALGKGGKDALMGGKWFKGRGRG